MTEIDTAEIRREVLDYVTLPPRGAGWAQLIRELCDALDEAREGLAWWVDEANKRGNVVLHLMDVEKRAEKAEAHLDELRAQYEPLNRRAEHDMEDDYRRDLERKLVAAEAKIARVMDLMDAYAKQGALIPVGLVAVALVAT